VAETIPGYEAVSWFGLFGPAGIPADTVAKINKEVRELFTIRNSRRRSSTATCSSRSRARPRN
jgi:tripartite-type tricarboxylate transporter receptor subunit TctC